MEKCLCIKKDKLTFIICWKDGETKIDKLILCQQMLLLRCPKHSGGTCSNLGVSNSVWVSHIAGWFKYWVPPPTLEAWIEFPAPDSSIAFILTILYFQIRNFLMLFKYSNLPKLQVKDRLRVQSHILYNQLFHYCLILNTVWNWVGQAEMSKNLPN